LTLSLEEGERERESEPQNRELGSTLSGLL